MDNTVKLRKTSLAVVATISTLLISGCDKLDAVKSSLQDIQLFKAGKPAADYKPTTIDLPALQINQTYSSEKKDWKNHVFKSATLSKNLALISCEDTNKFTEIKDDYFCPTVNCFGKNELEPELASARDELFELASKYPDLGVQIGACGEKAGDDFFAMQWYEKAAINGSKAGFDKLDSLGKSNAETMSVAADFYAGIGGNPPRNPLKAAEFAALALQADPRTSGMWEILEKVVWDGPPRVAAAAWKALVNDKNAKGGGSATDLLNKCNQVGGDILDPASQGKGAAGGQDSSAALQYCLAALELNPENPRAWHNYAWALSRSGEHLKALIGYARAAELGYPISIGRYWWNVYSSHPETTIDMLTTEGNNGNPWGYYFLGSIYSGDPFKRALDIKRSTESYLSASNYGIEVAFRELGDLYYQQKDYEKALEYYKKASETDSVSALIIGIMYEQGSGVKTDTENALVWYRKAKQMGNKDASQRIASLENMDKQAPQTRQQRESRFSSVISSGSTVCGSVKSFYKVNAIEMTGNNYIPLPYDCDILGAELPVNVLQRFSDPVVGEMSLVGNEGGSIYVRSKDVIQ